MFNRTMKIVNLTPHALHIRRADGTDIVVEPSGVVPRLEVSRAECAPVLCEDGVEIAVSRATFGALTGMPVPSRFCHSCRKVLGAGVQMLTPYEEEPSYRDMIACPECGKNTQSSRVIFVVSALCAQSPELVGRNDVFAPGEALRDNAGKIIGATGLSRINPLAGAR